MLPHYLTLREEHCDIGQVVLVHLYAATGAGGTKVSVNPFPLWPTRQTPPTVGKGTLVIFKCLIHLHLNCTYWPHATKSGQCRLLLLQVGNLDIKLYLYCKQVEKSFLRNEGGCRDFTHWKKRNRRLFVGKFHLCHPTHKHLPKLW